MLEKIRDLANSYKLASILILLGSVLLVGGLYSNFSQHGPKKSVVEKFPKESIVSPKNTSKLIKVDVSGAVKIPGVYDLEIESRIEDAISKAGGFSSFADSGYISKKLNLSQKLSDGLKIYIPFSGESYVSSSGALNGSTTSLIGVNTADSKTLEVLPGIGAVTAQKIIAQRPYNSIDELLSKKAVSKSTYAKIKDLVDLN